MSLHAFSAKVKLPEAQYDDIVDFFGQNGSMTPREYQSVKPTFQIGDTAKRVGEIVFTDATHDEFAGVLFVDDSDLTQRNYDSLLLHHGIIATEEVPIMRFDAHLIAGIRISQNKNIFQTQSVVEARRSRSGQKLAERAFHQLFGMHISEYQITPEQVYDIAAMLQKTKKK